MTNCAINDCLVVGKGASQIMYSARSELEETNHCEDNVDDDQKLVHVPDESSTMTKAEENIREIVHKSMNPLQFDYLNNQHD